ncbi:hypothetical protein EON65_15910 [archaeon]|nr:MAG: hypothetical protein EON65_15910 [archaeon]
MELTKLIMSDFERLMGMESVEAYTGGLKIPINHLTWREIARITILAKVASGGFSENEINNMIKGRGFTTSPDNVDRKVLKLAKKRILLQYHSRHEVQETMYGFRWGLCVKIPVPLGLYVADNRYWVFLHKTISCLAPADAWVLPELLRLAKYIRVTNDCALVKLLACVNEVNSFVLAADSFPAFKDRLLQAIEQCCRTSPSSNIHIAPIPEMKSVVKYVKSHLELALSRDIVEKFEEANSLASAAAGDGVDEEGIAPALPQASPAVDNELGEEIGDSMEIATNPPVNQFEEDDITLAETLSAPMKRCYFVLRTLMGHSEGAMLCYISSPLGYRRRSRYWATLREVRKKLVAGGYENSIERFYRDIIYVIELGYMCNWDNSNHRHTIAKLQVIFERLFFEMVICCQEPLVYPECCPYCRTSVPVPAARSAVCDRCEGVYHIDCLDPPLAFATKSDWTCPACIEQRWVAHAHPYRLAKVYHPESSSRQGDVVGIELLNGEMVFVIDFQTCRELWSPSKVREYALPSAAGSSYDMPAGYSFEDYERTCCLCKAYVGYTTTFNIIPASLQEMYSKSMAAISTKDADFDTVRTGAALLSLEEIGTEEWLIVLQSLVVSAIRSPFNPINLPFSDDINGMVKCCLENLKESEEVEDDFDITEKDDSSSMSSSLGSGGFDDGNDEDQEDELDEGRPIKKARINSQSPLASEFSEEIKDIAKSPINPLKAGQEHHISALMWKLIGREDALQANELVKEAVATLDLDFKSGTDMEDLQPLIKEQLGEFLPLAMSTVIKSCTVKPAEITDLDSWTEGWSETMEAVNFDLQQKPLVCALCNNTEEFLCNPMVHLPDQATLCQRKHINWELVDYHEDIDEDVRIAHYFCAHTLHSLLSSKKVSKVDESFDAEDYAVVERLCTVGTPCLVPLGTDRDSSNYWVFKQSPYIFVQSGPAANRIPSLEEHSQLDCSWQIYKTDEEKARLISWLQPGHPRENRLRRALIFLNPHWEGFLVDQTGDTHAYMDVDKQATADDDDKVIDVDEDDDGEPIVNSTRSASSKKKKNKFDPKERVYVIGGLEPTQYWPADILSVDTKGDSIVYKVRYDDWDETYDAYLDEEQLMSEDDLVKKMGNVLDESNQKAESAVAISRKAFFRKQVFTAPEVLFSLQASSYLRIPDRECGQRPPMGFSSCLSSLEQIRAAMLIIEAALPCGAVDDSEDRWADDFVIAWREAVMTASDPVSLMQCQILLEYGIRTSWLKPTGLKLFSCLPSRAQSLKQATYGMVAIRVWLLDMTIKYDKVQIDKKEKSLLKPDLAMANNPTKKKKR